MRGGHGQVALHHEPRHIGLGLAAPAQPQLQAEPAEGLSRAARAAHEERQRRGRAGGGEEQEGHREPEQGVGVAVGRGGRPRHCAALLRGDHGRDKGGAERLRAAQGDGGTQCGRSLSSTPYAPLTIAAQAAAVARAPPPSGRRCEV